MRKLLFTLIAVLCFAGTASAAVDMEFIPIQDMASHMNIKLFSGPLSPAERAKYFPGGEAPAAVNVFLIKTGGKNILVDTGYGSNTAAKGSMLAQLASAGIKPQDIDLIFLTHMHGDHILGLLKGEAAVFPKAVVFASKPEVDFWLAPATLAGGQYAARAKNAQTVAKAYGDRFKTFAFNDELIPGITALDGVGHTPGHTLFMLQTANDKLLIVGDLVHAAELQFAHPEECASYDMDRAKAVETRKAVLNRAVAEKLLIAAMHAPKGGVGHVQENGTGGFVFTPLGEKK